MPAARVAMHHPILVYTHAKRSRGRWRWYHMLSKFVLFALAPTALWFNAHQHIAYGGLLGQYYLEGLVPYLQTFFVSWGVSAVYLLLYASLPGGSGLVKGLSFALLTWFFRVVMYAASQWVMFSIPARAVVYTLATGLGEMLVVGMLYGITLAPA